MCQREYGNTSAVFVAFEKGTLEFISRSPKFYHSSDIAKRGFCSDCGSPTIFFQETLAAVFVGTLDGPENWQPNGCHLRIESIISWDIINDNQPRC